MAIFINKALDNTKDLLAPTPKVYSGLQGRTTEHEYISPENKMTVTLRGPLAEAVDHTNGKRWGLEKQQSVWRGGNGKRGELSRKMVAYLETRLGD